MRTIDGARWRRSAPMRIRAAWSVMQANLGRGGRPAAIDEAAHADAAGLPTS